MYFVPYEGIVYTNLSLITSERNPTNAMTY